MNITKAQYIKNEQNGGVVIKATIDGKEMFVPKDVENNRHYQAIQEWIAEGNTIEDAD